LELEDRLPEPWEKEEAIALLSAAQKNLRDLNKKAAALPLTYLEEYAMFLKKEQ
jgi:hypothetical protein